MISFGTLVLLFKIQVLDYYFLLPNFFSTCYTKGMKKYEIIYNSILNDIQAGKLILNNCISSESELCTQFDTSRVTVRKALHELERDGYIRKKQGKGSIVVRNVRKSKTVLLVIPNIFKYIFSDLIKGIEETLREQNITLLIANSFNNQNIERNIIRSQIDSVDAIIFEPAQVANSRYGDSKTYNKLLSKPTVCINAAIPEFGLPYLILDDKKNMELVTKHIVSTNVKRILVMSKTDDLQGYSRLQGIKTILDQSKVDSKIVEFTTENEEKKFRDFSFLYFHYKPDCIMFYNDEYAYKFMSNYNINPVIDNLLITGFDNTEYSNGQPYSFISPNHPKAQMGIDAANMIIKLLDGEEVESKIYEPEINFDK